MTEEVHDGAAPAVTDVNSERVAAMAALEAQAAEERQRQLEEECREVLTDILLSKGLYHTIDTETKVGEQVLHDLRQAATVCFDSYCVGCRREATFRIQTANVATRSIGSRHAQRVAPPSLFAVRAVCQRRFHVYTYIFSVVSKRLIKIGQFPSLADISHGELRSIDKSLDDVDRRELGKALGLYAHDTALGAFVYLRRVFERMIHRAHERQSIARAPVEGFITMKMRDRIEALKAELPEKVVQNSAVFSVLSVGIHELTEEQCAQYFPILKAALFQMLEQEEHKRQAEISARETEAALQDILADVTATAAE